MQAMKGATMALGSMNKQMNLPSLQRIAMEFERENDIMEQRQEMVDSAVDDAMDVGVEEEGDEVVEQVLEEIGVDFNQSVGSLPRKQTESHCSSRTTVLTVIQKPTGRGDSNRARQCPPDRGSCCAGHRRRGRIGGCYGRRLGRATGQFEEIRRYEDSLKPGVTTVVCRGEAFDLAVWRIGVGQRDVGFSPYHIHVNTT